MPIVHDPNTGRFVSGPGGMSRKLVAGHEAYGFLSAKTAKLHIPIGYSGNVIKRGGKHIVGLSKEGQHVGFVGKLKD